MKFIYLLCLFFSVSISSNVLDDLIIKKKPVINQILIELIASGLNDQTDNSNSKLGEEICMAGGGSSCKGYYGPDTIAEAIESIPFKDRTYWWDRFTDQYGNYQWRCRGGQTKQFAEDSKCSGVNKDDERWPG